MVGSRISPSHSSCCSLKMLRSFTIRENGGMAQAPEGEELEAGCWPEAEIRVASGRRNNRTSLNEDRAKDIGRTVLFGQSVAKHDGQVYKLFTCNYLYLAKVLNRDLESSIY